MKKYNWPRHRPLFALQAPARPQKLHWQVLPILWLALKRACTVLGAFVLFLIVVGFFIFRDFGGGPPPSLPHEMVLYLELKGDPGEMSEPPSLVGEGNLSVHGIIDALDHASGDKRVKGLFARMEPGSFALARSEELRAAIKRFETAGKFAYIYSSSYGEGAGDLGRYYVASAFQELWLQPMGLVSIAGVRAEVPFVRSVLDKVGVRPQFYQRKEFKNAYESATNKEMSAESRKELTTMLRDIKNRIMADVPAERGLKPEEFSKLVDTGLFTAPEALEKKLVTNVGYADVLVGRIKQDITGDPESDDSLFVDVAQYGSVENVRHRFGKSSVALIYVVGAIMESASGTHGIAAADEIAPAIYDAAFDENVKAIVLRIDSPGGSPVASESILRAVERAKEKGKPVIVSMGPTAASGGYWVAAYADQIFVLPTTITGSIGVLGGKLSLAELWKKLGVNWDKSISWGENSGIWSMNTPFDENEAERVNNMLDHVYASFVARVAKGRGLTPEQVDKIAGGRVWSGEKAKEIGLADQIGGLREALDYTATILGEKDRNDLNIFIMPEPKTPLEQLLELVEMQGGVLADGIKFQNKISAYLAPYSESAAVYEPLRIE